MMIDHYTAAYFEHSPKGIPTLMYWRGLCGHMTLRAMLVVAYATGRASHARRIKVNDPDEKGYWSSKLGFGCGANNPTP